MNYLDYIADSFIYVPLAAIILNNILPKKWIEKQFHLLAGMVTVLQMLAVAAAFYLMSENHFSAYAFSVLGKANRQQAGAFNLTAVALVFLFCVGLVTFISVLIAKRTVDANQSSYVNLLMTLMIGMNGMLLVSDLFSLYVFLDVVGISSFVMIALFRSRTDLEGSIKYLVISALATIFILTALSFIFMQTGSLSYDVISSGLLKTAPHPLNIMLYFALILLIAGFAIKTGAVPFHSWLPDAHQSADTAVSVLLSGIVIKVAGIYSFVVLTQLFAGVRAIQVSLAVLGMLSIVTGALLALRQDHFKRIVAYSSVSQMGYILLGLSTGSTLGLIAAVAHVFSHATFKSTLFANAAALHEQTGTLNINEMGGLQNRMPVTAFSSIIAFLSTAGIPPFLGFWSKFLIIMALWNTDHRILGGFALCVSILTAAYFLRLQKKVFFGKTPAALASVSEIDGSIKFAEILLTAITVLAGILFPLILLYLQSLNLV
ncbi:MAG: NADH-quinone oxidoreductase subunit L [Negativicutes bacterium]|nr:NADH-quinone oxidoreductase subunit L [Negativicutes bacterium]